jgi:hypothetical protein
MGTGIAKMVGSAGEMEGPLATGLTIRLVTLGMYSVDNVHLKFTERKY